MPLPFFSHKYNQKDFAKNSQQMSDTIQSILMEVGGAQVGGAGRLLNGVMLKLQQMEYPTDARGKAIDGKAIEAIDERIFKIIGKIRSDCQNENYAAISIHAQMLFEAVSKSRCNGKEKHSPQYLQYEEACEETYAQMCEAYKKVAGLNERMNKALEKAQAAAPDSYEYQVAKSEYLKCQTQLETIRSTLHPLQKQYNNILNQMGLLEEVTVIQAMPEVPKTGAQLASWVADCEAIIERKTAQLEEDEGIMEESVTRRHSSAGKTQNDAFDVMIQDKKAMDMQNQIANSTGSLTSRDAAGDAFDALVKSRK